MSGSFKATVLSVAAFVAAMTFSFFVVRDMVRALDLIFACGAA